MHDILPSGQLYIHDSVKRSQRSHVFLRTTLPMMFLFCHIYGVLVCKYKPRRHGFGRLSLQVPRPSAVSAIRFRVEFLCCTGSVDVQTFNCKQRHVTINNHTIHFYVYYVYILNDTLDHEHDDLQQMECLAHVEVSPKSFFIVESFNA